MGPSLIVGMDAPNKQTANNPLFRYSLWLHSRLQLALFALFGMAVIALELALESQTA
jgi:hypothetical protein